MYQFLKGIITERISNPDGLEKLILDVNGIGYEIYTSPTGINVFSKTGETVTVYTTLIHREDSMLLYGFPTLLERELFNLLCSVSGIGPRSALNILSNLTVSEISHAILTEDTTSLAQAQGIGPKTASRIILELKEKIKGWQYLPIVHIEKHEGQDKKHEASNAISEARTVLQSLGYSNQDINQAVTQAKNNGDDVDPETLVHFSLKWLANIKKN